MNISLPFIKRPIATTLLTLAITLSGLVALRLLPVSPVPAVDFPTISVSASMPGASPETMAATVATPLERSLGAIAGITEMTSQSSLSSTRITLQFDLKRDINGAARDVQAALNAARSLLPSGMPSSPTYRKVNPADAPIMIIAMTSDSMTQGQMFDIADTVIAQKLAQVKGIGQVTVGGSSAPAVRIELNPPALNKYGVSAEDVRTALSATNANRPKGFLEDGDKSWQIEANDQASLAKQYLPMIVAYRNNAPIRVSDIARVDDSVSDLRNAGSANGKPSVVLILSRQPGANIVETIDSVRALLPEIKATIPPSIKLEVGMDRSPTIRASLADAELTLLISIALVIMVVFLFLRNARATLIPSVVVPVSLIGTFGVMYLLDYSLDIFSTMALTVATGFVVDDAIVVLENISRHIENGMNAVEAAIKGSREVGFTVLSMTLSLIAVFIPILLMGGIVGRLFREFAVTITVALLVSLLISLTTTPMMCSLFLKSGNAPGAHRKPSRFDQAWDRFFNWMIRGYERILKLALRYSLITLSILFVTIGLNIFLYIDIPKGFFPEQDNGLVVGGLEGDQSLSFQAMKLKMDETVAIVLKDPDVAFVIASTGGGRRNSGMMYITLKPLSERSLPTKAVIDRMRGKLNKIAGANLFLAPSQDIRVGGRQSNAMYQYTLQSDDLAALRLWEPKIREALSQLPDLTDVNTDSSGKGIQTSLVIDRDLASQLGINMNLLDSTLSDLFGQRQISTIYSGKNQYHVVMEAAPEFWQSPETLNQTYISSNTNTNTLSPTSSALSTVNAITANGRQSSATMLAQTISTASEAQIPLSAIATFKPTTTSLAVNHQSQFVASTISFNLKQGVSLSTATDLVAQTMARLGVPTEVHGSFQGTAAGFSSSQSSEPLLILAALLTIYIVLGILYESYVHPITILSTLPSAGIGALLALQLAGMEFDLIGLIGVLLLIGIVKKNAILMIDFAIEAERSRNLSARDAIYEACVMRFRPIMMTTLAAMLGALPLVLSHGFGSELRRPLGVSIIGGLAISQLLTLFTTPIIYLYMDSMRSWSMKKWPLLHFVRFPFSRRKH